MKRKLNKEKHLIAIPFEDYDELENHKLTSDDLDKNSVLYNEIYVNNNKKKIVSAVFEIPNVYKTEIVFDKQTLEFLLSKFEI